MPMPALTAHRSRLPSAGWPGAAVGILACTMLGHGAMAAAPVLADTLEQRLAACTACHASKQRSDGFFPRIAGKPAGYLYNQLINFRDGRRNYPLMTYMVDRLPDAYLHEIATYFSQQDPAPLPPVAGNASSAVRERGRQLANVGDAALRLPACSACHGAGLGGVAPAIPGLLGLSADYINAQLGAWKNRQRLAQQPDCMARIASRLAPADIAAVAGWLASQPAAPLARPASAAAPAPALPMDCGSVDSAGQPSAAIENGRR